MVKSDGIIRCRGKVRWGDGAGYTMIELFTVTIIIGILSAMSVIFIARAKVQARETVALGTLSMMTTAYEAYHFRHSEYPQWGPDQDFASPQALIDRLIAEKCIPSAYWHYEYFPAYQVFKGFAQDYLLQIPPMIPDPLNTSLGANPNNGTYKIILVPRNSQKRYLAAMFDPVAGKVTVRTRKGDSVGSPDAYRLFTFKD